MSSVKSVVRILCVVWAVAAACAAERPFEFAEATIEDLQSRMAAGTLTSRELTGAYLARIAEIACDLTIATASQYAQEIADPQLTAVEQAICHGGR